MSSDEASSGVTYTSIWSDYEELSYVGSVRVVVYGYDGLPMHPVNPPSTDYVPGPKEPEQAPLSLDYVSGPEYPKYLALSDEEIPIEDQPYDADSPIARSLGYIVDSDLEDDLEDETKDGPTDYPSNGGDDDDDSSRDDADNKDEEDTSNEEEEEHLAPADFNVVVSPVVDPVPSAEETETFKIDESAVTPPPPPAYRTTTRMSIRAQAPIPFQSEAEAPLGFRAAKILLRATSPLSSPTLPPTHHPLPLPLPPLPPPVDRREEIPKADIPPWKRLCLTAPILRFEVRESPTAAAARQPGLGLLALLTMDDIVDAIQEEAPTTLEGVNARVTEPVETHERDTQDSMIIWRMHRMKMAPRRGTRIRTPTATATATTTTPMTDASIRALIAQGIAAALAK
nr:hypothetical protein [Tanacetum cinerariifolium]